MSPQHGKFQCPFVARTQTVRDHRELVGGSRSNQGFTLIEVLIVIMIIGVLAALLIPVAATVMENQKTSKTVNSLRQLQLANINYAGENSGRFAPLYEGPALFQNGWTWNPAFLEYLGVEYGTRDWRKLVSSGFYSGTYKRANIAYVVTRTPEADDPWASAGTETPHSLRQANISHPNTLIAFIDANDWLVDPWQYNKWPGREKGDVSGTSVLAATAYRNSGERAAAVTYSGSVVMLNKEDLDPNTKEGARRWFFDAP